MLALMLDIIKDCQCEAVTLQLNARAKVIFTNCVLINGCCEERIASYAGLGEGYKIQ